MYNNRVMICYTILRFQLTDSTINKNVQANIRMNISTDEHFVLCHIAICRANLVCCRIRKWSLLFAKFNKSIFNLNKLKF